MQAPDAHYRRNLPLSNRAESLRRTLDSLSGDAVAGRCRLGGRGRQHNCIDHTDAVIKAFADRLPIRREFEPERGLSHARNRAVDAAKGDYIVWTDDDVVVAPGWLAAYIEAFRRWPGRLRCSAVQLSRVMHRPCQNG